MALPPLGISQDCFCPSVKGSGLCPDISRHFAFTWAFLVLVNQAQRQRQQYPRRQSGGWIWALGKSNVPIKQRHLTVKPVKKDTNYTKQNATHQGEHFNSLLRAIYDFLFKTQCMSLKFKIKKLTPFVRCRGPVLGKKEVRRHYQYFIGEFQRPGTEALQI